MKLFHWHLWALKDYSLGDIIVMAENLEQARALAVKAAQDKWPDGPDLTKQIENDVAEEPNRVFETEPGVIFITGGA